MPAGASQAVFSTLRSCITVMRPSFFIMLLLPLFVGGCGSSSTEMDEAGSYLLPDPRLPSHLPSSLGNMVEGQRFQGFWQDGAEKEYAVVLEFYDNERCSSHQITRDGQRLPNSQTMGFYSIVGSEVDAALHVENPRRGESPYKKKTFTITPTGTLISRDGMRFQPTGPVEEVLPNWRIKEE